jgi:hypothetical protein
VRFLASEADLDDALLVFHQQQYRFPAKLPHLGQFSDPVEPLECRVIRGRRLPAQMAPVS